MKANAPKKIYLQKYDENTLICLNKWNISEEWTNKPFNEKVATNIEYTRTDAFIEKACEFLNKNISEIERYEPAIRDYEVIDVHCKHYDSKEDFLEDFKKYMEETKL